MDRFWLLTWTTYGSWLPGDQRGFVGWHRDEQGNLVIHNAPGTPQDSNIPALERAMRESMKGSPIRLRTDQADRLFSQFQETADYRGWLLFAVAIMANHVHLVVGVPGDPEPATILHDFKSYGTRRLNKEWGKPINGTWWTESGSRRKLAKEENIQAAMEYVRNQEYPLLIWINEKYSFQGERGVSTPR